MSGKFSAAIDARLEELQRVQAELGAFGEEQNWPSALAFQIQLAVEEIGLNIINYGYDDQGPRTIEINLVSDAEAVTVEIIDDARPFDPLADTPEPDVSSGVDGRRVGGLGVHLLRSMMDDMRYQRADGKNHLTLVQRRNE